LGIDGPLQIAGIESLFGIHEFFLVAESDTNRWLYSQKRKQGAITPPVSCLRSLPMNT